MARVVLPFPFQPETTVVDERFVIKGELGQGGMGRCYRVLQKNLERMCVLKMLAPKLHPMFVEHTDARIMLENEAKILGLLASGNDSFVQVFDRGVLYVRVRRDGRQHELDLPYYVMEHLHGQSLEVIIDGAAAMSRTLPVQSVLSLCQQAAKALRIAHARGIIHRDVKPDNMFLEERDDRLPTLKLIDFGVSTREGEPHVHGTGTIRYGAPELLGKRVVRESTQSDMYPLGLVFYELMTLRGPHVCSTKEQYMMAHIYEEAPDVRQFRPDCPPRFAALVGALLSKDPEARPTAAQTDEELTDILAGLVDGGSAQAQLSSLLPSPRERAARRERSMRTGEARHHGATLSGSALSQPDGAHHGAPSAQFFSKPPRNAPARPPVEQTAPLAGAPPHPGHAVTAPMRRDTIRGMQMPPIEGLPPLALDEAVTQEDPLPFGLGIEDIPNVPVFSSMGQIFDAVWEDDTKYQPSPFEKEEAPRPPPRMEKEKYPLDLRGVQRRSETPVASVRHIPEPARAPAPAPTKRQRRLRVLPVVLLIAAAGIVLALGVRQVPWGRAAWATTSSAAPSTAAAAPPASALAQEPLAAAATAGTSTPAIPSPAVGSPVAQPPPSQASPPAASAPPPAQPPRPAVRPAPKPLEVSPWLAPPARSSKPPVSSVDDPWLSKPAPPR